MGSYKTCHVLQVARLAGIGADIVSRARLAGQHIEDKLQVISACSCRCLDGQDFSRTYLAHHELESVIVNATILQTCLLGVGHPVFWMLAWFHAAQSLKYTSA